MPIRIYALAKEIKIDSKELVELCVKAGIPGKGSALASLDDDEVAKLKSFLAGPKKSAARSPAPEPPLAPIPPQPPSVSAPVPPSQPSPAAPAAPPVSPIAEGPGKATVSPAPDAATGPVAPPSPVAIMPSPVTSPSQPVTPVRPGEPAPFTRADYISPAAVPGKIRVLDVRKRSTGEGKAGGEGKSAGDSEGKGEGEPIRPGKRREPVINLARLPELKQHQLPPPKSADPPTQKPDIRLPKDAIRTAKAGTRPPLEHLTAKVEQQRKPRPNERPGPHREQTPAAPPATGADAPLSKATKGRRHHDEVPETRGPDKELAGMASARADRQKSRKLKQVDRKVGEDDDDSLAQRRARRLIRRRGSSTAAPRKERVAIQTPCTVREFSEATGVPAGQILKAMFALGTPININATLTQDQVELLAAEIGLDMDVTQQATVEEQVLATVQMVDDDPQSLEPRPPVVTFLGHVDHGKTSLLDRIIGINVASREAGGITQHIRAYDIARNGRHIAFVDTPGHEAFTEMRARGANVTDIAVLVVAADDGVMPQTEEAISHAKAAGVPIVVALNKMDLPGAKPDRVLQQLATLGLVPSEWSGDVEVIRCSAVTGAGLDDLLETLLVTADLHEYKANPSRAALGVCLEAEQEPGRGVIAKMIVKNGTLHVGDIVVCGAAHGRVKAMYDTLKPTVRVKKAGPSTPVNLTGLDMAPQAGDSFYVLSDIAQARELAASRATLRRESTLQGSSRMSFQQFQDMLAGGKLGEKTDTVNLNLIIRADVRGSIEAIQKELGKLSHPEVQIRVLQASVGGVTVADVTLANASDAVIIGFNVIPDDAARALADERKVEIRRYDIIYKVADDIKAMLEGKLKPEERVVELGQAIVKQTFVISRMGTIAGCYVSRGAIERGCRVRVFRDGRLIGEYPIDSLRRERDDVREVTRGLECGIHLGGFNDVKKDDVFEAYKVEEFARTL